MCITHGPRIEPIAPITFMIVAVRSAGHTQTFCRGRSRRVLLHMNRLYNARKWPACMNAFTKPSTYQLCGS